MGCPANPDHDSESERVIDLRGRCEHDCRIEVERTELVAADQQLVRAGIIQHLPERRRHARRAGWAVRRWSLTVSGCEVDLQYRLRLLIRDVQCIPDQRQRDRPQSPHRVLRRRRGAFSSASPVPGFLLAERRPDLRRAPVPRSAVCSGSRRRLHRCRRTSRRIAGFAQVVQRFAAHVTSLLVSRPVPSRGDARVSIASNAATVSHSQERVARQSTAPERRTTTSRSARPFTARS